MLRRSSARCQPGLNWRWPSTVTFFARALKRLELGERLGDLVRGADDADQVVHRLLQLRVQRVRVLGAVALERLDARPWRPRRASRREAVGRSSRRASRRTRPRRRPARRPKTSRSDSELPPRRFEPCMPPETSPAANRPGTPTARLRVGVDLDATHDVVAGRTDLHRLLGDVDVGQLLELVPHRREALLDDLGRQARGDVEEDAAVRGCRGRP